MDKYSSLDFYSSDLSPKSKWLILPVVLSIIVHIVLLYGSRFYPMNQQERDNSSTVPLRITLSPQPDESSASPPSQDISEAIQAIEQPETTLANPVDSNIVANKRAEQTIAQSNTVEVTKPKQLNHQRLASVISQTINEDVQAWEQSVLNDCQQRPGDDQTNCDVSQQFPNDTPSKLAGIFAANLGGKSQVREFREQDRLLRLQKTINATLATASLPKAMEEHLMRELNYVREEQRFADCGGQLNKGACAGEVDIVQLISNVGKLINKVTDD